ncbi:hypothetical protein A2U01_0104139, partial [Trifolium medium]|nr:hypothetical protein [Trifolium medium]
WSASAVAVVAGTMLMVDVSGGGGRRDCVGGTEIC